MRKWYELCFTWICPEAAMLWWLKKRISFKWTSKFWSKYMFQHSTWNASERNRTVIKWRMLVTWFTEWERLSDLPFSRTFVEWLLEYHRRKHLVLLKISLRLNRAQEGKMVLEIKLLNWFNACWFDDYRNHCCVIIDIHGLQSNACCWKKVEHENFVKYGRTFISWNNIPRAGSQGCHPLWWLMMQQNCFASVLSMDGKVFT